MRHKEGGWKELGAQRVGKKTGKFMCRIMLIITTRREIKLPMKIDMQMCARGVNKSRLDSTERVQVSRKRGGSLKSLGT